MPKSSRYNFDVKVITCKILNACLDRCENIEKVVNGIPKFVVMNNVVLCHLKDVEISFHQKVNKRQDVLTRGLVGIRKEMSA